MRLKDCSDTAAPSRPILRLKTPVSLPPQPSRWRCKPCGAVAEISGEAAEDEIVRCPHCNAKLGRVAQFRRNEGAVRARRILEPGD